MPIHKHQNFSCSFWFCINLSITKSTKQSGIVCHFMESPILIILNLTWAHHEVLSLYENEMAKSMGIFMKLCLKCKFGCDLYLKKSLTYLHLPIFIPKALFVVLAPTLLTLLADLKTPHISHQMAFNLHSCSLEIPNFVSKNLRKQISINHVVLGIFYLA